MSADPTRYAYVALCPTCRLPFGITADTPAMRESNASWIGETILAGATVERWPVLIVSRGAWCDCRPSGSPDT